MSKWYKADSKELKKVYKKFLKNRVYSNQPLEVQVTRVHQNKKLGKTVTTAYWSPTFGFFWQEQKRDGTYKHWEMTGIIAWKPLSKPAKEFK